MVYFPKERVLILVFLDWLAGLVVLRVVCIRGVVLRSIVVPVPELFLELLDEYCALWLKVRLPFVLPYGFCPASLRSPYELFRSEYR